MTQYNYLIKNIVMVNLQKTRIILKNMILTQVELMTLEYIMTVNEFPNSIYRIPILQCCEIGIFFPLVFPPT